jgi:hypothetical protein
MKAAQVSIRESLAVGKGSLSGDRAVCGPGWALDGSGGRRRPVSIGVRGVRRPCGIMVHKAGILD